MAFMRKGGYRLGQSGGWDEMGPRQGIDGWLLGLVLVLLGSGVLMVYSSTCALGILSHRGNDLYYFENQLVRALVGVGLLLGLASLDPRLLSRKLAWTLWGVALFVLVLLVVPGGPGVEVRGATRWLLIGGSMIQPAEFARVALVICLAGVLSKSKGRLGTWRGLLPPVGIVLATAGLIAIQPHLSLALLTAGSGMLLIFLAGGSLKKLVLVGGGLLTLAALVSQGYQHGRLMSFLGRVSGSAGSAGADAGYQSNQSLIGIGSGGLTGLGLGRGMQKHFFVPDPHTDFILSMIGEELGLLGLVCLFGLTAWITVRIFRIGRHSSSAFGELLAYGIGLQFLLAALLHSAVCLGLAPTTGVPYPLVSFGGSALIANLIGVGLVLSISRRQGGRVEEPEYRGSVLLTEPWMGRALR